MSFQLPYIPPIFRIPPVRPLTFKPPVPTTAPRPISTAKSISFKAPASRGRTARSPSPAGPSSRPTPVPTPTRTPARAGGAVAGGIRARSAHPLSTTPTPAPTPTPTHPLTASPTPAPANQYFGIPTSAAPAPTPAPLIGPVAPDYVQPQPPTLLQPYFSFESPPVARKVAEPPIVIPYAPGYVPPDDTPFWEQSLLFGAPPPAATVPPYAPGFGPSQPPLWLQSPLLLNQALPAEPEIGPIPQRPPVVITVDIEPTPANIPELIELVIATDVEQKIAAQNLPINDPSAILNGIPYAIAYIDAQAALDEALLASYQGAAATNNDPAINPYNATETDLLTIDAGSMQPDYDAAVVEAKDDALTTDDFINEQEGKAQVDYWIDYVAVLEVRDQRYADAGQLPINGEMQLSDAQAELAASMTRLDRFDASFGGSLVVQPGDSLWAIAERNVDTLLTPEEQEQLSDDSNAQTGLAMNRLMEENPQFGFNPTLMDGVVTSAPGDPDTLIIGNDMTVGGSGSYDSVNEVIENADVSDEYRTYLRKVAGESLEVALEAELAVTREEAISRVAIRTEQYTQELYVNDVYGLDFGPTDGSPSITTAYNNLNEAIVGLQTFDQMNSPGFGFDSYALTGQTVLGLDVDPRVQGPLARMVAEARADGLVADNSSRESGQSNLTTIGYELNGIDREPMMLTPVSPEVIYLSPEYSETSAIAADVIAQRYQYVADNSDDHFNGPTADPFKNEQLLIDAEILALNLDPDVALQLHRANEFAYLQMRGRSASSEDHAIAISAAELNDTLTVRDTQFELSLQIADLNDSEFPDAVQIGQLEQELTDLEMLEHTQQLEFVAAVQAETDWQDAPLTESQQARRERELIALAEPFAAGYLIDPATLWPTQEATVRERFVGFTERIGLDSVADRFLPSQDSIDNATESVFGWLDNGEDPVAEIFGANDSAIVRAVHLGNPSAVADASRRFHERRDNRELTPTEQAREAMIALDAETARLYEIDRQIKVLMPEGSDIDPDTPQAALLFDLGTTLEALLTRNGETFTTVSELVANPQDDETWQLAMELQDWKTDQLRMRQDNGETGLEGLIANGDFETEVQDAAYETWVADNELRQAIDEASALNDRQRAPIFIEPDQNEYMYRSRMFDLSQVGTEELYNPIRGFAPGATTSGTLRFEDVNGDGTKWKVHELDTLPELVDSNGNTYYYDDMRVERQDDGRWTLKYYIADDRGMGLQTVQTELSAEQVALWRASASFGDSNARLGAIRTEYNAAPFGATLPYRDPNAVRPLGPEHVLTEVELDERALFNATDDLIDAEIAHNENPSSENRQALSAARTAWGTKFTELNRDIAKVEVAQIRAEIDSLTAGLPGGGHLVANHLYEELALAEKNLRELAAQDSVADQLHFETTNLDSRYGGSEFAMMQERPTLTVRGILEGFAASYAGDSDPIQTEDDVREFVAINTYGEALKNADGEKLVFANGEFDFSLINSEQQAAIEKTVEGIWNAGGLNSVISASPIAYGDEDADALSVQMLYRVVRSDGEDFIIDVDGSRYNDEADFRNSNETIKAAGELMLVMPEEGKLEWDENGNLLLTSGDGRIESGWESKRRRWHIDTIVTVIGVAATVVIIVGSGGTATPLVAAAWVATGATMAYGLATAGAELVDAYQHGRSINPLTDGAAFMNWLTIGSMVLPSRSFMGSTGAAIRGARVNSAGMSFGRSWASGAGSRRTFSNMIRNGADDTIRTGAGYTDDVFRNAPITRNANGQLVMQTPQGTIVAETVQSLYTQSASARFFSSLGGGMGGVASGIDNYNLVTNWENMSWEDRANTMMDATVNGVSFVHGRVLPRVQDARIAATPLTDNSQSFGDTGVNSHPPIDAGIPVLRPDAIFLPDGEVIVLPEDGAMPPTRMQAADTLALNAGDQVPPDAAHFPDTLVTERSAVDHGDLELARVDQPEIVTTDRVLPAVETNASLTQVESANLLNPENLPDTPADAPDAETDRNNLTRLGLFHPSELNNAVAQWRATHVGRWTDPAFLKQYINDIHLHFANCCNGGYDRSALAGNTLASVMYSTAQPGNPHVGPRMVVQAVPHQVFDGTGYYLETSGPTGGGEFLRIPVTFNPHENVLIIDEVIGADGKVLVERAVVQRPDLRDGVLEWSHQNGMNTELMRAIPLDAYLTVGENLQFQGLIDDLQVMNNVNQTLRLHPDIGNRLIVGLSAVDPGSVNSPNRIAEMLWVANKLDPDGQRLQMMIGETTWKKEFVIEHVEGMASDLSDPVGLGAVLDYLDQMATGNDRAAITIHVDSGEMHSHAVGDHQHNVPGDQVRQIGVTGTSNYENWDLAVDLFRQHPDTTIIWAHAAGLGRTVAPGSDHIARIEQVLNDPSLSHVMIDLSWDAIWQHLGNGGMQHQLATLVKDHPTRFIYGSDSIAINSADAWLKTADAMRRSGFLHAVGDGPLEGLMRGNFNRVVDSSAHAINEWRTNPTNRDNLEQQFGEQGAASTAATELLRSQIDGTANFGQTPQMPANPKPEADGTSGLAAELSPRFGPDFDPMASLERLPELTAGDASNAQIVPYVVDDGISRLPDQSSPFENGPIFETVAGANYDRNGRPLRSHTTASGDVRVIEGSAFPPDANGVYSARIELKDPSNSEQWIAKDDRPNEMFPIDWDAETIQREVAAAWNSPDKVISQGWWMAQSPSGIWIEGRTGANRTAHPVYEGAPGAEPVSGFDFDHIAGADTNKKGKPTGGHTTLAGDVRFVDEIRIQPDANGVYGVRIEALVPAQDGDNLNWVVKKGRSNSMFPSRWDEVRLKTEIEAAWNHPERLIIEKADGTGYSWFSYTPSGIRIKGFLSLSDMKRTAFPLADVDTSGMRVLTPQSYESIANLNNGDSQVIPLADGQLVPTLAELTRVDQTTLFIVDANGEITPFTDALPDQASINLMGADGPMIFVADSNGVLVAIDPTADGGDAGLPPPPDRVSATGGDNDPLWRRASRNKAIMIPLGVASVVGASTYFGPVSTLFHGVMWTARGMSGVVTNATTFGQKSRVQLNNLRVAAYTTLAVNTPLHIIGTVKAATSADMLQLAVQVGFTGADIGLGVAAWYGANQIVVSDSVKTRLNQFRLAGFTSATGGALALTVLAGKNLVDHKYGINVFDAVAGGLFTVVSGKTAIDVYRANRSTSDSPTTDAGNANNQPSWQDSPWYQNRYAVASSATLAAFGIRYGIQGLQELLTDENELAPSEIDSAPTLKEDDSQAPDIDSGEPIVEESPPIDRPDTTLVPVEPEADGSDGTFVPVEPEAELPEAEHSDENDSTPQDLPADGPAAGIPDAPGFDSADVDEPPPRGVAVVQAGQSLWVVAKNNVDTLLSASERAAFEPGSDAESLEAMYRLIEINPELGFNTALIDGVASNSVGDPDTLLIGAHLRVRLDGSQIPTSVQ